MRWFLTSRVSERSDLLQLWMYTSISGFNIFVSSGDFSSEIRPVLRWIPSAKSRRDHLNRRHSKLRFHATPEFRFFIYFNWKVSILQAQQQTPNTVSWLRAHELTPWTLHTSQVKRRKCKTRRKPTNKRRTKAQVRATRLRRKRSRRRRWEATGKHEWNLFLEEIAKRWNFSSSKQTVCQRIVYFLWQQYVNRRIQCSYSTPTKITTTQKAFRVRLCVDSWARMTCELH